MATPTNTTTQAAPAADHALAARPYALLAEGTPFATPVYLLGDPADPVVLVTGGIHGDEPAGYLAARHLVDRGTAPAGLRLLIVPVANAPAVALAARTATGHTDLNRSFPGDPQGPSIERLAHDLLALVTEFDVAFVIDMHESLRSIFDDASRLGDTVLFNLHPEAVGRATELQARLRLERPQLRLAVDGPAAAGSLVDAAGRAGVPGLIVESDRSQGLEARVDYHRTVVDVLLRLLRAPP